MTLAEVFSANPTGLTSGQLEVLRVQSGAAALVGATPPEGNVTGTVSGQMYLHVQDGTLRNIYVFQGTPGQNTGWVTTA